MFNLKNYLDALMYTDIQRSTHQPGGGRPTPQKRTRRRAAGGYHPTRGPRTPFRKRCRREHKRRKQARAQARRRK